MPDRVIELHDTTVAAIVEVGRQVVVLLKAYIHQSEGRPGWDAGSGWLQAAALTFTEAEIESNVPDLPADICEGSMSVEGDVRHNLLPLPFHYTGSIALMLSLDTPADLVIRGSQVTLTLLGEPVYIEAFPESEPSKPDG